jgi:branched-subunit amino acid ABC-type transport system permease component
VTFQLLRNFFDNHGIFSKIRKFSVIVFGRRCVPYAIVESFQMKFLFTIVLKNFKIFIHVIYIIYCYLLNLFFQNGP